MTMKEMKALLDTLEMAFEALTIKVTPTELAATKAALGVNIACLRSDIRMAEKVAA